ncbi:MAG: hypothetical protein ACXVXL_08665 [Solirubrobacteraceae bacterium]
MPQTCLRATSVAALVTIAAMVCATPAGASRPANAKERRAITNAVHASPVGGINKVPRSHYQVTGQRVSTVSKSWAIAQLVATPPFRTSFQNATVLAIRPAGTNGWVVVDVGTAEIGCGIAPNKVLADLFKTKTPCPPGQGIS